VTRKFIGFKKVRFHTHEVIGYGDIHLPDLEVHTSGCWFDVPRTVLDGLPFERDVLIDALSGVAHALKTVACAALMCAERDLGHAVGERQDGGGGGGGSEAGAIGGAKRGASARAFDPTVFLYDSGPGGIGLAPEIHRRFDELVGRAGELLGGCGCGEGCPACLGPMPAYHGGFRRAARALVEVLAGRGERYLKPAPKAVMHGAPA
jgi:DEAD/DEAH box helicase domain-containing protein